MKKIEKYVIIPAIVLVTVISVMPGKGKNSGQSTTPEDEITAAYLQYNAPPPGVAMDCQRKKVGQHDYVNCKRVAVSGGTEAGLWLVEEKGSSYEYSAINGKAATALDHFGQLPNFKRLPLPQPKDIDIAAVLGQF